MDGQPSSTHDRSADSAFLDEVEQAVGGAHGANEVEERTPLDAHVLGMYARGFRLFRGVKLLIDASRPLEALALARPLFDEPLHLPELAQTTSIG